MTAVPADAPGPGTDPLAPLPIRTLAQALALVAETAAAVPGLDRDAQAAARARLGQLTKPPGSLGRLEDIAARIAGIRGEPRPRLRERLVVIACGDHGVARRGVSAYPPEVTAQMVRNFAGGGAAISVLAAHAGARVVVVDAAVDSPEPIAGSLPLRLGRGTADITAGPAMSAETAARAVAAGIDLLQRERAARGVDIVVPGEMGIGNSTAAAAIVARRCAVPPASAAGRGTGVDDRTFARKVGVITQALDATTPDPDDGLEVLRCLGGVEIGVLAGVMLAAAAARIPVVVDGFISTAAALITEALAPQAAGAMLGGHRSAEPGHVAALRWLGLQPLLDLGMRLGEGSGAALGLTLCVAACRLLDEMATFEEAAVSGAPATATVTATAIHAPDTGPDTDTAPDTDTGPDAGTVPDVVRDAGPDAGPIATAVD